MTKKEREEFDKLSPWRQMASSWNSRKKRKAALKKAKTTSEKVKAIEGNY